MLEEHWLFEFFLLLLLILIQSDGWFTKGHRKQDLSLLTAFPLKTPGLNVGGF